jgi:hypothetical protein
MNMVTGTDLYRDHLESQKYEADCAAMVRDFPIGKVLCGNGMEAKVVGHDGRVSIKFEVNGKVQSIPKEFVEKNIANGNFSWK